MQSDTFPEYENQSLGAVLRDIGVSAKDLIQSEINLFKTELKDSAQKVGKHSAQVAIFGALLVLSVLPFMAFLVIGLGKMLDDRYWLSSLIVAIVFAAIGGGFAYRSFKKIKSDDVDLSHARSGLGRELQAFKDGLNDLKTATNRRTV